jgi:hypothetical protein
LIKQFYQIIGQGLTSIFCCFKEINGHLFKLPIKIQKINEKDNTKCVPFDIHESKLVVVYIRFVNFNETYICFIFSTKLGNISWDIIFLKRKTTQGHKCKTKCLNQTFFTNYDGNWFFTIKRLRSCKNYFCCTSFFLKVSLTTKNFDIALLHTLRFLFVSFTQLQNTRIQVPTKTSTNSLHNKKTKTQQNTIELQCGLKSRKLDFN